MVCERQSDQADDARAAGSSATGVFDRQLVDPHQMTRKCACAVVIFPIMKSTRLYELICSFGWSDSACVVRHAVEHGRELPRWGQ
eukprot:scaffold1954_cov268-Pinguiococcus_pyrenoidosus.AAC.44